MPRKSDIFVNVYDWDPWWVRWMSMRWWLTHIQLTFNGTRGFRRKNQSVSVFVDVKGRNSYKITSEIATAVADVLLQNGFSEDDLAGYQIRQAGGITEPVGPQHHRVHNRHV